MPHISFATTDLCDLNRLTTNSIEGSELTGGYTVTCPCLLGFLKMSVLHSFDKRQT